MPCTTPPCIWPSTSIGLMMVPKSLTEAYFTTSMTPVSGSISTSATWQPLGKADGTGSLASFTSSELGTPSGSFSPARSFSASSMHADRAVGAGDGEAPAGELDVARPRLRARCAAICLPFSTTLATASTIAVLLAACRARAAGAAAGDQLVAVALQQADALERNAEPARQHLRERRRVALAVVERAGDDGHVPSASKRMPPISLFGGAVTSR